MTRFRGTVDYGDERVRTYAVTAETLTEADEILLKHAEGMLTVCASDDLEETSAGDSYDDLDLDGEL